MTSYRTYSVVDAISGESTLSGHNKHNARFTDILSWFPAAGSQYQALLGNSGGTGFTTSHVLRSDVALEHTDGNGTVNQVLQSDGDGTTSWATVGTLTDGDKGDITVASSGTVWTIDNDVITTVKILNSNVTTAKIADDAVTEDKINTIAYALSASTSAINAQTGTTYTVLDSDNGKIITLSNASGITVTFPDTLPANFSCTLAQIGAGQVTVAVSGTLTLRNSQSFTKLFGQWASASVVRVSDTNDLILMGDLSP